jgi:hypothetical protein
MKMTYGVLLIVHVLLVFLITVWLLAQGRDEIKKIPKGFISLNVLTLVLSLAMMQINMMQHNEDPTVELLDPYKYGVKTIAFVLLIGIAFKYYKRPAISQRVWQAMIGLMTFDLIITGVWM